MEREIPRKLAAERLQAALGVALGASMAWGGGDQPGVKTEIKDLLALAERGFPLKGPA